MSPKIVLNGKEYDGIESMPPDVRKDYETVLESLKTTGSDEVLSMLRSGEHTSIKATFRDIVVNGTHYGSVDEMPPDVRKTYEEAVGRLGASGSIGSPPARPSTPALRPPLAIEPRARRSWAGRIFGAIFWMAVGVAIAVWAMRRGYLSRLLLLLSPHQ
ncbi:MAG TPA: hypothetical protein VM716_13445 [Gemmatimonadales bacterium]|nr:hypothetical protein [Gemmatimonadales bacterium]